jgi:hypothetical protein
MKSLIVIRVLFMCLSEPGGRALICKSHTTNRMRTARNSQ